MKKSVIVLVFFLVASLTDTYNLAIISAQGTDHFLDEVLISSPANKTYDSGDVIVVQASKPTLLGRYIRYAGGAIVDGVEHPLQMNKSPDYPYDPYLGCIYGNVTLPKLSVGQHNVMVWLNSNNDSPNRAPWMKSEATIFFSIGDAKPPNITLALNDAIFKEDSVPINFVVNEPTVWTGYSLDNGAVTDVAGNITLSVPAGDHTIVVYANDTAGNIGESEMAHFTVQPTANFTIWAAILITGIAIGVIILAVFKKRKPLTPLL
jgi:hypothetical protein